MPRPQLPPHLVPRQPKTALAWSMQKQRLIHGATGKQIAQEFGCSPAHISRVEQGSSKPSRELVQFYDDRFEADGLLLSLFEVAVHAPEQERRRAGGKRPRLSRTIPGDSSTFVSDTIPHGTLMEPVRCSSRPGRCATAARWPGRGASWNGKGH